MPTHFHKELDCLKLKLLEMAATTEKAVEKSMTALNERNRDLAQEVIDNDCVINEMQAQVDESSLKLLALEQPMAKDLRFIVGSIHVAVNLERAADQAVNIAERALLFAHRPEMSRYPAFDELAEHVLTMLSDSIRAFNQGDVDLAQKVCAADARADELNYKVLKHYIDYMIEESRAVERAVHLIILGRCLERIGDLATNVAEYVLFIVKGVNVKSSCHQF